MSSMVHPALAHPSTFFKDKPSDHLAPAPAFTAVNGRNASPSPTKLSAIITANEVPKDKANHSPPLSRQSPDSQKDPKPHSKDNWRPPRPAMDTHQHDERPTVFRSPTLSDPSRSPPSPHKRKRSSTSEDERSLPSPDAILEPSPRLDSYPSMRRDSPNTVSRVQQLVLDHPPPSRTLPPMDHIDTDRSWAPPRDPSNGGYHDQHRDILAPIDTKSHMNGSQSQVDLTNGYERSSTTEITRAGVQVDPKKRKRQFANRTKTGCGTCRRRKKKCDEAKPECNNCTRGGFICEGYANKIPWPKNGTPKQHPILQSKDRFPIESAQLYHSHGAPRESYSETSPSVGSDGARSRPIVVEEHDRPPVRSGSWTNGWAESSRPTYSQEQPLHSEYSHTPAAPANHGRPSSSEQHVPPSTQAPPRQHSRIYHHTPQTMRENLNNAPSTNGEHAPHHPPPLMAPHTAAPPGPPPQHYAPPPPLRHEKTEKAKMIDGEPFLPFDRQLIGERDKCKNAVYQYNNTNNPNLKISTDEVGRYLHAILAANWTQSYAGKVTCGHLGKGVYVDTPFMCDYGYNIHIGNNVDIGTSCKFLDSGEITIGRNTSIGSNVTIDTVKTPTDPRVTKGSGRTSVAAKVHIGDNVHIGANCTILAGVSIGTGAIVHPGSVVVRDIPANCVARGNPADYV